MEEITKLQKLKDKGLIGCLSGPSITWSIPQRVELIANITENRFAKQRRKKLQYKYLWAAYYSAHLKQSKDRTLPYPCTIRLTRCDKRKIDYDHLVICFKYIVDEIASFVLPGLPRGQADDKIKWEYAQESSKVPFYRVEFFDD